MNYRDHGNRRGDRRRRTLCRAQLLTAARGRGQRRGRMDHRCRGPPLPGLPGGLFGGQLRPSPPRDHRRRPRPARHRHPGQPRLPLRPARPVLRGARRAVRQGHGAADEQRRRGRRERHQGGPQVGHRRQGRARRRRPISSWRTTTSTAAPRPSSASPTTTPARRGFGPYTPGLPVGALRRRRRAGRRDRRGHRRRAARAHPGRGGHHRAARRLPAARCARCAPSATC